MIVIVWFILWIAAFPLVTCLTCHQCGNMYDGSTFMGIEKFKECQFFEHDVTEENRDYLVPCPPQDKCCFTLREHMTLDFWGHSAAAEVLVRGCCSKLNQTKHHLVSSSPPPLVLTEAFKAEVLSQTIQNGPVKTRILFCNTLGCNNSRVPWSKPVTTGQGSLFKGHNRRQSLEEEQNIINLFESHRSLQQKANMNQRPKDALTPNASDAKLANAKAESESLVPKRSRSMNSAPSRCECNCNCPSLVCPSFLTSSASELVSSTLGNIPFQFITLVLIQYLTTYLN